MTRVLVIIAVVGFVLATVCFAGVAALGGRDLAGIGWFFPWAHGDWNWDWDPDEDGPRRDFNGPTTTREIAWRGGNEIQIAIPADVVFTQGPNAKLTITGPKDAVDRIVFDGERLRFRGEGRRHGWGPGPRWGRAPGDHRLQVSMTSRDTRSFSLFGSPDLRIENYDQDSLDVDVNGGGEVVAKGRTRRLDLAVRGAGDADFSALTADNASVEMMGSGKASISPQVSAEVSIRGSGDVVGAGKARKVEVEIMGSGDADLSGVDAEDAEVQIMGSGKAAVAPRGVAEISILGSGDVSLASRPAQLQSHISGSGKIKQPETQRAAPTAPAPAAAPAKTVAS